MNNEQWEHLTLTDKPEEINISEMWVVIFKYFEGTVYFKGEYIYTKKPDYLKGAVAIITVKDWQDIQSGKRNLRVGEGL